MAVYVLLAPLAASFVPLAHRKAVLITLDIVRACIVLALPFVTDIWQVYLLVALLQSASACFTPLFQSLIPEILVEERDYTRDRKSVVSGKSLSVRVGIGGRR